MIATIWRLSLTLLIPAVASRELIVGQNLLHNPTTRTTCQTLEYYGTYGDGWDVFIAPETCQKHNRKSTISLAENDDRILVWIQEAGVDKSLLRDKETCLHAVFASLDFKQRVPELHKENQDVLSISSSSSSPAPQFQSRFITPSATGALISIPFDQLPFLDTYLPAQYVPILLPSSPLPLPSSNPKPRPQITQLRDSLSYNEKIASIVNSMPLSQFKKDIRYLTGEDTKRSNLTTRHSFTEGALEAAEWIKQTMSKTGAECFKQFFAEGWAPNVICEYAGTTNTTETIILGGHYDSRGSFGSTRAPGADDDGSGTISLLSIARTIARLKIKFHINVQLVAFSGEEQGLVGSRYYARKLREEDKNLTMMIQADMLAYHAPGEPPQLGVPTIGDPDLITYFKTISSLYSPELTVGPTMACCSDHQSFHEQGFSAVMAFERTGPIADPMYHNSGDLSNRTGYDLEQVRSITKVSFATLLHASGFDM